MNSIICKNTKTGNIRVTSAANCRLKEARVNNINQLQPASLLAVIGLRPQDNGLSADFAYRGPKITSISASKTAQGVYEVGISGSFGPPDINLGHNYANFPRVLPLCSSQASLEEDRAGTMQLVNCTVVSGDEYGIIIRVYTYDKSGALVDFASSQEDYGAMRPITLLLYVVPWVL